jgi:antitoxin ParD1/3/4
MTVKSTITLSERHQAFLAQQVAQGAFASESDAVAEAIETMMENAAELDAMVMGMTDEIRRRAQSPPEDFISIEEVFGRLAIMREEAAKT